MQVTNAIRVVLTLALSISAVGWMPSNARAKENLPQGTVSAESLKSLSAAIMPTIKRHRGDVGVVIKHLPTGETFAYQPDKPMATASLIKLPVMMAAYKAVNSGKLSLDKMITLKKEDQVPGSGVLSTQFSPGLQLSLRDAIQLMIAHSDNTATNLVIDQIGLDATNELMKSLDCPETRLNAKVYRRDTSNDMKRSREYGLGSTTAAEMVKVVEMIQSNKFLGKERCAQMLAHLFACESRSKVPRFLPAEVKVAHKTGSVSEARTDAGFIDTPAGPIAFCVLTSKNEDRSWGDSNEAELLAGEIGLAAYNHFMGDTKVKAPAAVRVLRIGAEGDLVEALQRTLNARVKPSPNISADGDFGPNTESAVMKFQKQERLDPNGVVDRKVWQALGPLVTEDEAVADPQIVNSRQLKKQPIEPLEGMPVVTCKGWAFIDAESGDLLAGENVDGIRDPASTTKLMTAYVVLKFAKDNPDALEQIITFSKRADDTTGSTSGVKAGEKLPVSELLYGLMLPSGNDASVALAEHFGEQISPEGEGESYDRFIEVMNSTAGDLGMKNTGYRNPHGLTAEGHVTTAGDMTKLARVAMKLPLMREICSTRQRGVTVDSEAGYQRNIQWNNTNRLLQREGYTGVKTGTTGPAGACLVGSAERDGRELIGVVLGSSSSDARYADFRNLYRWVLNNKFEQQGENSNE